MIKKIWFFLTLAVIISLAQNNNQEFRSAWVITWDYMSGSRTAEQNKEVCRNILDNMKAANMNAVIWQVRQGGTAYYPSSFEPWGSYAGSEYPGYDPLAYAIEQAHLRGLEIHVWFNSFHCSSQAEGAPAAEHPEWICRDRTGNPMAESIALSPGMEAVRNYTVDVAMEIVRNYDIDGLHLDYVRWNEYTSSKKSRILAQKAEKERFLDGMISTEQLEEMNQSASGRYLYDSEHPYENGVPEGYQSWEDWWRSSVTEFVKTLQDSVKAEKPWVKLSAAVLGRYNWGSWQGYGDVFQDGALWFNEGYVDQLMPMHYHWKTGRDFYNMLSGDGTENWGHWLTKGILEKRLYSVGPGSYTFETEEEWNRHPEIVHACRQISWVDGFQFFAYTQWADNNYWAEAGSTFFQQKTKIRPLGEITHSAPGTPSLTIEKIDSLTYSLKTTPSENNGELNWFVLYRNDKEEFHKDSTKIIGIGRSDSSYTFVDSIPENHSELRFYYQASIADRYWIESQLSETAITEDLPLIPAKVIQTQPETGSEIKTGDSLIFWFSKPMTENGLENVTLNPEKSFITALSTDGKQLAVSPLDNWDYDVLYTLTISENWKDSSGLKLDGDQDGLEGGDFVYEFKSEGEDDDGPIVSFMNPTDLNKEDFDLEDVITIAFDEIVADETLTENSLVLTVNGEKSDGDFLHFQTNGKSVVTFKSEEPLPQNGDCLFTVTDNITDTLNNPMNESAVISFHTSDLRNSMSVWIDRFNSMSGWKDPGYSGSTVGIVGNKCSFELIKDWYVPGSASKPVERYSAALTYEWAEGAEAYLLREYLADGSPREIIFNTNFVIQCYIYGDGSGNQFRFAIDEADENKNWINHEVSNWITIDWVGWKLVEWKLDDPSTVGMWDNLGNGALDLSYYRIDSFQLTHPEGGAVSGAIYFDDLRMVRKTNEPVSVEEHTMGNSTIKKTALFHNYPNPFNPSTVIQFSLEKNSHVELAVYNLMGRKVNQLVNKSLPSGNHLIRFDGKNLASGIYLYRLEVDGQVVDEKKMTLVK